MKNGPEGTEDFNENNAMQDEHTWTGESALERDLTAALRHVDSPRGFADRVVERALAGQQVSAPIPAPEPRRAKVLAWPALRPWIGGAVAAALVAGLFATETAVQHRRAQERRVSQATAQFETTERITDRALEQARRHIAQAGVPLD